MFVRDSNLKSIKNFKNVLTFFEFLTLFSQFSEEIVAYSQMYEIVYIEV